MFKGLRQLFSRIFQKDKPRIVLEQDGFSLFDDGGRLFLVKWSEVLEVFGFKEDWGTVDCICLGFRVSDDGTFHEVNEEMPGWEHLVKELDRVFPNTTKDWWKTVAFPAFATNRTTIWGKGQSEP